MMMLRRKKKEKKAKKLLEAAQQQQAALMQQQNGSMISPAANHLEDGNLTKLPSVSTEKLYNIEETSSEGEMDSVSLAMSEIQLPTHYHHHHQQYQPTAAVQHGSRTNLVADSLSLSAAHLGHSPKVTPTTAPIATISPQQVPPTFINSAGVGGPPHGTSARSHSPLQHVFLHKRVQSQPAMMVPDQSPTGTFTAAQMLQYAQQLQQQQQLQQTQIQSLQQSSLQQTSSNGTLKKKKKISVEVISPEKMELISRAVSLGLGRGVDATDKMPWMNKKPFQIRRVHTSIIETNEGGILMNYNHEVQSIAEIEEKLLSSLNPPESTVAIHIEDELDRNVTSSRRVVGRRMVNRSIGFQGDFEEKYKDGEISKSTKESFVIPKDPAEIIANTQKSGHTFEERLCEWIIHRLVYKGIVNLQRIDADNPIDQLVTLMRGSKNTSNFEDEIVAGCLEVVRNIRVTHYVTGIQLGAAEYRVMSDGQYHKKIASEGAFGVDSLATAISKSKAKLTKKDATKCSQLRQLGKLEDGNSVSKENEVVLQVQVQPITRLIKLPVLKSAVKTAVEKYMQGTPSSEGGPFVIKCTGRDLYLTANKFNNYEVEATDIPTEASLFYFQTTDDGGNPFEFHIAYYGEDVDPNDQTTTTTEQSTIGRYLEAPLSAQGKCPGPLLMKHSVKVKNTRFTLRSRLSKKNNKSHLAEWIAGEDAFYIACATKKYQHGSYLAVKAVTKSEFIGKHLYMTCCDPSIHHHNGENAFMLFQLTSKEAVLNKDHASVSRDGTELSVKKTNTNNIEIEVN